MTEGHAKRPTLGPHPAASPSRRQSLLQSGSADAASCTGNERLALPATRVPRKLRRVLRSVFIGWLDYSRGSRTSDSGNQDTHTGASRESSAPVPVPTSWVETAKG